MCRAWSTQVEKRLCLTPKWTPLHAGYSRGLIWNFPGKSTGVGCHFLLQGNFLTQGSNPGLPHCWQMLYHLSHQGSPKNTGVDCPALLQGIFPTQRSNPGLPHYPRTLYPLSHQGSRGSMYQYAGLLLKADIYSPVLVTFNHEEMLFSFWRTGLESPVNGEHL